MYITDILWVSPDILPENNFIFLFLLHVEIHQSTNTTATSFQMKTMKKALLFVCSLLIILKTTGQSIQHKPMEKVVNNIVLYQALNNFNHSLPLFLITPGFVMVSNVTFRSGIIVSTPDFEDHAVRQSPLKQFQQDITEAFYEPFIPYFPKDSSMLVRFIHDKQMLLEMRFVQQGDTLIFTQSEPGNAKSKIIKYVEGRWVSTSFEQERQIERYTDAFQNDTLRLISSKKFQHGKLITDNTRIYYADGRAVAIERSTKSGLTIKNKDQTYFRYDNQNRLLAEETYKSNGKLRSIVSYHYNENQLQRIERKKSKACVIDLAYDNHGILQSRTYKTRDKEYVTKYIQHENQQKELTFVSKKGANIQYSFSILPDVSQRVAEMDFSETFNEKQVKEKHKRWLLDYNELGNLSSIKLLNHNGKITKEITVEYSFYSL